MPSATALECGPHVHTYAELDARANRLAHHLRARGIGEGSRVAILVPRSVDMYAALLAVGKAGGTFVPIDPAAPAERVAFIVTDAEVDAVLTVAALAATVDGLRARVVALDAAAAELAAAPATRPLPAPARRTAPAGPRAGRPTTPPTRSRTSCTPRAPAAGPRAWPSPTPASATSSPSSPPSTTCARTTGSTRA
ncbi:AMP-binding protein [Streptomyces noursei]|nr:AMP-binding protein [Streptomyces noursei]